MTARCAIQFQAVTSLGDGVASMGRSHPQWPGCRHRERSDPTSGVTDREDGRTDGN